jgi:DNA-binding CsgD family transcriptional regulator
VLDATMDEIMPVIRPTPVDEPNVRADHLLSKTELGKNLNALVDAALARSGALNSDEDLPDFSALAEEANLTLAEYEAVAMTLDGHSREAIAKFQHLSVDSSRSNYRRGLTKIRQYVLNSPSATFLASVLRGHLGGDEA